MDGPEFALDSDRTAKFTPYAGDLRGAYLAFYKNQTHEERLKQAAVRNEVILRVMNATNGERHEFLMEFEEFEGFQDAEDHYITHQLLYTPPSQTGGSEKIRIVFKGFSFKVPGGITGHETPQRDFIDTVHPRTLQEKKPGKVHILARDDIEAPEVLFSVPVRIHQLWVRKNRASASPFGMPDDHERDHEVEVIKVRAMKDGAEVFTFLSEPKTRKQLRQWV
jgi:hypothetical protein